MLDEILIIIGVATLALGVIYGLWFSIKRVIEEVIDKP